MNAKCNILEAVGPSFASRFTCCAFQRGQKLPKSVKEDFYCITDDNCLVSSNSRSLCFHSKVPWDSYLIYEGPIGNWVHVKKPQKPAAAKRKHLNTEFCLGSKTASNIIIPSYPLPQCPSAPLLLCSLRNCSPGCGGTTGREENQSTTVSAGFHQEEPYDT